MSSVPKSQFSQLYLPLNNVTMPETSKHHIENIPYDQFMLQLLFDVE